LGAFANYPWVKYLMTEKIGPRKNLLQFLIMLTTTLILLFIISGTTTIYLTNQLNSHLFKLDQTVIGPSLIFSEITIELKNYLIYFNQFKSRKIKLKKQKKVLKKISRLLKGLLVQKEKYVFKKFLIEWFNDWESFKQMASTSRNYEHMEKKISSLVKNMAIMNS